MLKGNTTHKEMWNLHVVKFTLICWYDMVTIRKNDLASDCLLRKFVTFLIKMENICHFYLIVFAKFIEMHQLVLLRLFYDIILGYITAYLLGES